MSSVGKGGLCVGLTTLPFYCVDFLEVLGSSNPWSPRVLPRSV